MSIGAGKGAGISVSGASGMSAGQMAAGNAMANAANAFTGMSGRQGHAEGTTSSAISGGSIVIRDKENQRQDVAELSRDVEHANGSIAPIFDKEKEQQRLKAAREKHGNPSDAELRNLPRSFMQTVSYSCINRLINNKNNRIILCLLPLESKGLRTLARCGAKLPASLWRVPGFIANVISPPPLSSPKLNENGE